MVGSSACSSGGVLLGGHDPVFGLRIGFCAGSSHMLLGAELADSQIVVRGFDGVGITVGSPAARGSGLGSGDSGIFSLEGPGSGGDLALEARIIGVGVGGLVLEDPGRCFSSQDLLDLKLVRRCVFLFFGVGFGLPVHVGQEGLRFLGGDAGLRGGLHVSLPGYREQGVEVTVLWIAKLNFPQPGQPDGRHDGSQAQDGGRNRGQGAGQEAPRGGPEPATGGLGEGAQEDCEPRGGAQQPREVPRHAVVEAAEEDPRAHGGDAEAEDEGRGVAERQDHAAGDAPGARGASVGQSLEHRQHDQEGQKEPTDTEGSTEHVGAQDALASLVTHRSFPD